MPNLTTQSAKVGNLFREAKPLVVPKFQRDYSWDLEKVEQLWEDTWHSIEEGGDTYFLGSIVVKDSPAMQYGEVIDGQQRLTTLSLLMCALRDAAKYYSDERRALKIEFHYLAGGQSMSDEDGEIVSPKLTPNKKNRQFYIERILNNPDLEFLRAVSRGRKEDKSNRLMASAYIFFRDKIVEKVQEGKGFSEISQQILDALD